MLSVLQHIPDGLLTSTPQDLHKVLAGPTLIHLPGRRPEALFVSVLLHGNEPTGLYALQKLLQKYQGQTLPRALSVFIGNVAAAREGHRHLEGQPDYNRVWPHAQNTATSAEHVMMHDIVNSMRERQVFASIDVHNNTGLNPHYGCINQLEQDFLHLATLFSRTVVYFIRPQGVQSMAFADLCPAITVECGKPDQQYGVDHAFEFLDTALHLSHFPEHPVAPQDMDIYHTVATVYVPEEYRIAFGNDPGYDKAGYNKTGYDKADICFAEDLDHLNFRELPIGTSLGRVAKGIDTIPLSVINEAGEDVSDRYFQLDGEELRTTMPLMPSMFTLDREVIHQDCLGYLMERIDFEAYTANTPK